MIDVEYRKLAKTLKKTSLTFETLMLFVQRPVITMKDVMASLGVSKTTASKLLKVLRGLNLEGRILIRAESTSNGPIEYSLTEDGESVLNSLTPIEPVFSAEWNEFKAKGSSRGAGR